MYLAKEVEVIWCQEICSKWLGLKCAARIITETDSIITFKRLLDKCLKANYLLGFCRDCADSGIAFHRELVGI